MKETAKWLSLVDATERDSGATHVSEDRSGQGLVRGTAGAIGDPEHCANRLHLIAGPCCPFRRSTGGRANARMLAAWRTNSDVLENFIKIDDLWEKTVGIRKEICGTICTVGLPVDCVDLWLLPNNITRYIALSHSCSMHTEQCGTH